MPIKAPQLEALLRQSGCWPPPQGEAAFRSVAAAEFPWTFPLFARALGATSVLSMDASPYEGADLVHDLNRPIPPEWAEGYDALIDGGTLEHVFNFPVAISNCMKLVKTGGHLMLFTPANNYFGHGFYQFSPELFYRVLAPENGFVVERMIALADNAGVGNVFGLRYPFPITGPWHEVPDPAVIHRRVTLINHDSVILMVLARKTANVEPFKNAPQQSDYLPLWAKDQNPAPAPPRPRQRRFVWLRQLVADSCYSPLGRFLTLLLDPRRVARFRRKHSFQNRANFRRVDD